MLMLFKNVGHKQRLGCCCKINVVQLLNGITLYVASKAYCYMDAKECFNVTFVHNTEIGFIQKLFYKFYHILRKNPNSGGTVYILVLVRVLLLGRLIFLLFIMVW